MGKKNKLGDKGSILQAKYNRSYQGTMNKMDGGM